MTLFVTEPLSRDHDRKAFHCGVEALDRYLREFAFQDIDRRVAGCFVALDDAHKIVGYYTLAATSIALDDLPADKKKRLPRYQTVPAILIGRLAVDEAHRGRGIGSGLIVDAVTRTDRLGIGAVALVVDAKDDAARAFYQATGFLRIVGEERRMFLEMAVAMAGLK
ncbi:MAG: GNAT family N-acetyltransferase [Xanthobacteraceae bacterium]